MNVCTLQESKDHTTIAKWDDSKSILRKPQDLNDRTVGESSSNPQPVSHICINETKFPANTCRPKSAASETTKRPPGTGSYVVHNGTLRSWCHGFYCTSSVLVCVLGCSKMSFLERFLVLLDLNVWFQFSAYRTDQIRPTGIITLSCLFLERF